jgi:hypothetical protein
MRLVLNMAKMAKEGCSRAAVEETKYIIKTPTTEVREEMKHGVEFPGNQKVKPTIQRQQAILPHNHMSCCLPCQNWTAKHPQTRWIFNGSATPPPD